MNDYKIVNNQSQLRTICQPITNESPKELNNLIHGMMNTMITNKGCGIAAPQVGVNKRLFIALLEIEGEYRPELFVNPIIISHSEETYVDSEGCLSVPNKQGEVERYTSVTVKYFNGRQHVKATYEGMNARVIQHEFDHLQGILYIDKAINITDNVERQAV